MEKIILGLMMVVCVLVTIQLFKKPAKNFERGHGLDEVINSGAEYKEGYGWRTDDGKNKGVLYVNYVK